MSQTYEVAVRINGDGSGLVTASSASAASLDKVAASADKVTQSLGQTFAVGTRHKQVTEEETQAIAKLDAELENLLGRLDPAQRQINQLNSAQGLLTRSVQAGLLSQQQYNEAMAQANAQFGAQGFEQATAGADKSAFATAGARRELIVLGHEAMTGNFSRMPGSFMVLAERVGASSALFSPMTALIVAAGVAVIGFAKAVSDARDEMVAMDNALAMTGNFAGTTRGGMEALATQVSRTGTLTIGTSKDIVTQLVASGRYSADNVALLAGMVENYANATGQSVEKVTPELIRMFEDPAKASETLNQQYHYLNVAELERIKTLQATGQAQDAATFAVAKLTSILPDHEKNIGNIQAAWDKAKQALSSYMDAAGKWGTQPTSQDAVAAAQAKLAGYQSRIASQPGAVQGVAARALAPQIAAAQAELDMAQRQVAVEEKLAQIRANALQTQTQQLDIQKMIETSTLGRINALEQEKTKITATNADGSPVMPDSAEKTRKVFEINKQIADLQRGMGAEAATMANQRIASELQLRDITLSMAGEQNDTALKLKQINQADHDATANWLALQKNAMAQIAVQEQIGVGNLTQGQRQALDLTLKRLQAEAAALTQKGNNQQAINAKAAADQEVKSYNDITDAIGKAGEADMKRLTASIAAQRLHNAEIGKTREQIELAKQASDNAQTDVLQGQADAIASMLAETAARTDLNDQEKAAIDGIYGPMLDYLNKEIVARRELAGLQGDAAIAEKNAAAAKAQAADYTRMFNTIEQTGKTVFTHLLSDGKNSFQAIGQALKASVIDLLYQLTVRPFIIQIGASIAQSMGINLAGSALGGSGGLGGLFSTASGANSISGALGGPSIGLSSIFGSGSSAAAYGITGNAALDAASMSGVDAIAGLNGGGALASGGTAAAGGLSAGLAAIPGWGWAALAALTVLSMDDGGGPKPSEAWLQGGPGSFNIGIDNAAGGNPDMNQVRALNAALNDPTQFDPAVLSGLVGTRINTGSPADTSTLIQQLTSALSAAATSAQNLAKTQQDLTTAQQNAASASSSLQSAVGGLASSLGIDTLTQAKQGLAISDFNSPLDRVKNAQDILDSAYTAAVGGDLTAVQAFPQHLQDALSAARDAYASGPEFQQIMAEDNAKLNDLLTRQQAVQTDLLKDVPLTIQQASIDQVTAFKNGFQEMVDTLNKLRADVRALGG